MYEVVKADTYEEALEKSKFKIGDIAVVKNVIATGGMQGNFTVEYEFEIKIYVREEKKDEHSSQE